MNRDHQKIKTDLDTQVKEALEENTVLQATVTDKERKLELLERKERMQQYKSVSEVAVQVSLADSSDEEVQAW